MAEEGRDITDQPRLEHNDLACDENQPTDLTLNIKQQHIEDSASSSESANTVAKNDEDMEQAVENGDSAETKVEPLPEGSSTPEDDSSLNMKEDICLHQTDNESCGDYNRESPIIEKLAIITEAISRDDHVEGGVPPETITSPVLGDRKDDQVDGPKVRLESPASNDTNTEAGGDMEEAVAPEETKDTQSNTTLPQAPLPQSLSVEEELDEQRNYVETNDVETIHPTTEETDEPTVPEATGGSTRYFVAVVIGILVAILLQQLLHPESPPQKNGKVRQIDIFLKQMEKVKTQFPSQRTELWGRSRIHLQRHLLTVQPTEPVSLILTAGLKAERTLHCLAQGLASAFSSSLNASVLHIDGASKARQDSDQVKLDIDRKLQGAFEGDKPVAVIHRFEELPPGSTLIFYRYCDHENAAYKKTFLIFTVLLGEEEEIPAKINLSAVEEMVDDHLQKKFLSHSHPVSFDKMDLDKYGGLWSRISHLILPVAAEDRIEHEGC